MNYVFSDFCRTHFLQLDFVLQTPILAQLCGEPGASLRWQEVVKLDDVRWLACEIFQELYFPVDIPVSQLQGVPEMKSHFFIYAHQTLYLSSYHTRHSRFSLPSIRSFGFSTIQSTLSSACPLSLIFSS